MANPIIITSTSSGVSRVVNLDYYRNPFNVTVAVTGSTSGTFSYFVEYTLDDQQYLTNIGSTLAITWISDASLGPTQTANGVTSFTSPVAGVRLTISSAPSSAAVTMRVLQG